jgi:hypothetical protein
MRRVFSMEADGISKFWKMNVMTKRPTASTVQMEERDSSAVSFSSCSCGAEMLEAGVLEVEAFSSGVVVAISGKVVSAQACVQGIVYQADRVRWRAGSECG